MVTSKESSEDFGANRSYAGVKGTNYWPARSSRHVEDFSELSLRNHRDFLHCFLFALFSIDPATNCFQKLIDKKNRGSPTEYRDPVVHS